MTELRDLRASISVQSDQVLEAVSTHSGKSKQQLVREILDEWAARKVHEAMLIERMTRVNGKGRISTD